MNLTTLRDRVRALTGIKLTDLRSDEQIDVVLNECYQEVLQISDWPFLRTSTTVTLTSGTDEFTMPTGFQEIHSVTYSSPQDVQTRMRQTTLNEMDYVEPDEEGDPIYYAKVDENTIRIWPAPAHALTLTVRGKESVSNLSAGSDEPVYAEQFHPLIAYRAAARILGEEGDDSGRSEFYQSEANNFFARMQQFYVKTADTGFIVLGSRRRRDALNAYSAKYSRRF